MAIAPNLCVVQNLRRKSFLPIITWNKKHKSKQVLSMIYIFGKDFFAAATVKGL